MLDNDDRFIRVGDRTDERDQFSDLAVDKARADFVQQHDPRLQRQGARDLQPLAPQQRERARRQPRRIGEPGAGKQRASLLPREGCADERRDRILRDLQIFLDGHVQEGPRNLIGAPDSRARPLRRRQARNVAPIQPN